MPTVAANVCCLWPGTNASIPTGWAKETLIGNDRWPKGAAAGIDPGETGGTGTVFHDHPNSAGHTHTSAHTHTIANSAASTGATSRDNGSVYPPTAHTHVTNPDTGAASTGLASALAGSPSVIMTLSFFRLIVIKSDGTPNGFPDTSVALWNDSAADPTSWGLCDGGGAPARPNISARYVRQAGASGDGGATGGTLTHDHDSGGVATHAHSTSHTHAGVTSSGVNEALIGGQAGGTAAATALGTHTHALTINSAGNTSTEGSSDTTSTDNHEPPFYTLAFEQNTSGGDSLPTNIIGLWMGLLADIPTDWVLCDGTLGTPDVRARFVKGAATLAGIGTTGGSLNHTHTATNHTHTANAHTHSVSWAAGAGENVSAGPANCATTGHAHSAGTSGSTTPGVSGSTLPVLDNYTDTQPLYTGTAYIQYQPAAGLPEQPFFAQSQPFFPKRYRQHYEFFQPLSLLGQDVVYGDPGQVPTFGVTQRQLSRQPPVQDFTWRGPLEGQDRVYGDPGQVPTFGQSERLLTKKAPIPDVLGTPMPLLDVGLPPGAPAGVQNPPVVVRRMPELVLNLLATTLQPLPEGVQAWAPNQVPPARRLQPEVFLNLLSTTLQPLPEGVQFTAPNPIMAPRRLQPEVYLNLLASTLQPMLEGVQLTPPNPMVAVRRVQPEAYLNLLSTTLQPMLEGVQMWAPNPQVPLRRLQPEIHLNLQATTLQELPPGVQMYTVNLRGYPRGHIILLDWRLGTAVALLTDGGGQVFLVGLEVRPSLGYGRPKRRGYEL